MKDDFHIGRIDFLRGIAILLVYFYHAQQLIVSSFELKEYNPEGWLIIPDFKSFILYFNPIGSGWIGVDLFLVISGFLIHLLFLKAKKFTLNNFYSKRFWRIYPPYLIALIFTFCTLSFETNVIDLISHIFLFHNLFETTFYSINPSLWSIALECQLYMIYPLFLFLRSKIGIKYTLVSVGCLSILFCLIGIIFHKLGYNVAFSTFVFKYWIVWCLGAFLAEKYFNNTPIFKSPFKWFICFVLLFILLKLNYFANRFIVINNGLMFIAFFEFILYSKLKIKKEYIQRILVTISFIGTCSFSIYLIHQPILLFIFKSNFLNLQGNIFSYALGLLLSFILTLLLAAIMYNFIEQKSINIGRMLRGYIKE